MLKVLSVASIFLLFFTGITASICGFMLIYDSSGKPLKMDVSILASSPFDSFFIPGIILFLFIGITSILIAFSVMNDQSYSTRLLFFQGIVMLCWIIVQVIMIRHFFYLQLLYFFIGAALTYNGYYGMSVRKKAEPQSPGEAI